MEELCDTGCKRHGDTNEAVLIDSQKDNVEPSETASRCPPRTTLTTAAFCPPVERPDPFDWLDRAKVLFLFVEIGREVMAHEGKEGGDGEGFVAFGEDSEVYRVPVVGDL
jgi:hypothetical protein